MDKTYTLEISQSRLITYIGAMDSAIKIIAMELVNNTNSALALKNNLAKFIAINTELEYIQEILNKDTQNG